MSGSLIVSDSVFVLCDEIVVSQQCAAELLFPLGGSLDYLIYTACFAFILGLFPPEFCLNNHIVPPISMWLLWLPSMISARLISPL